jgi:large subunit ribosomal protein L21
MYAIIETGGKQYKVSENEIIKVEKLDAEEGSDFEFSKVILINKDGEITTGNPYLENARVIGEVLETKKDKKIIVFKFKRRKNYKRKKGHRQFYTKLKIKDILT